MKPEKTKAIEKAKDHNRTPQEKIATASYIQQKDENPAPPVTAVTADDGTLTIAVRHSNLNVGLVLLMEALGTADVDFMDGLLNQIGREGNDAFKFKLSIIKQIRPTDHLEAMLAAQMAVVHTEVMSSGRRLASAENILQKDSAERALNKLSRTFISQMDALKRYRTGGEQKVTVQHVTVSDRGQAIVGNVTQNGLKPLAEEPPTSQPALTEPKGVPMPVLEEPKRAVVSIKPEAKK